MFRHFETEAIRALVGEALGRDVLERVLSANEIEEYWSGAGYFLTVADPGLPSERAVFDAPLIIGASPSVDVGFVVFVEDTQLALECHGWGDSDEFPSKFRDSNVALSVDGRPVLPQNVVRREK